MLGRGRVNAAKPPKVSREKKNAKLHYNNPLKGLEGFFLCIKR